MRITRRTLKGMIAASLILAMIPFILWCLGYLSRDEIPVLAVPCEGCLAIEIVDCGGKSGIYFIQRGSSVNTLMKSAGISKTFPDNFILKTGMMLTIDSSSSDQDIAVAEMLSSTRLAIGLPIDINEATMDELIKIKGVGPSTAEKIIKHRMQLKRFKAMNQLLEIKGIKEKRLRELQKYLYV